MFKLIHKLPRKVLLACSGGIDSMTALHWLVRGDKLAGILHVNHGTGDWADEAEEFVYKKAKELETLYISMKILDPPPDGASKEAYWRKERYDFFKRVSLQQDAYVVTAHNLDDCVEEYIINAIVRGRFGTIAYQNDRVIRPFRTWSRDDITDYAIRNQLLWKEDPSNRNVQFLRNRIRHVTLPHIYEELNPGLHNMVRRMIESEGMD